MRKVLLSTCLGAAALFAAGSAYANQELMKMSQNPKDWVMPTGDYANHRYSTLKQITADNVGISRRSGRSPPAFCAVMKARRL